MRSPGADCGDITTPGGPGAERYNRMSTFTNAHVNSHPGPPPPNPLIHQNSGQDYWHLQTMNLSWRKTIYLFTIIVFFKSKIAS